MTNELKPDEIMELMRALGFHRIPSRNRWKMKLTDSIIVTDAQLRDNNEHGQLANFLSKFLLEFGNPDIEAADFVIEQLVLVSNFNGSGRQPPARPDTSFCFGIINRVESRALAPLNMRYNALNIRETALTRSVRVEIVVASILPLNLKLRVLFCHVVKLVFEWMQRLFTYSAETHYRRVCGAAAICSESAHPHTLT